MNDTVRDPISRERVKSLCISTQPPALGGGIRREVDLIADRFHRDGVKVVIVHPENIRKDLFYSEEIDQSGKHLFESSISVRTFFPVYFASSLLYGLRMRRKLPESDLRLVIGSSALEATPFLFAGLPYICRPATTFWDEWRGVMKLKDVSRPLSWLLRLVNTICYPLTWCVERACYRNAAVVAAVSIHTKANIERQFSLKDVAVIHPPVDEKCFDDHPEVRNGNYVFSVGRLDPRKGLETLIRAFEASEYEGDLVVGGTGPELPKLERLAAELGVTDRVEFAGFVPDDTKHSLMQHADAFLLTSEQEGFGITLIEAMALRTPVIATRCGGPEDFVLDGETGFLADIGDRDAIASLIDRVTTQDDHDVLENAYRFAEGCRPSTVVRRLLDLCFEEPGV